MATVWVPPRPSRATLTGGGMGRHTDDWRTLSWHLGDLYADALCLWCDAQPEPVAAMEALLTVTTLGRASTSAIPGVVGDRSRARAVREYLTGLGDGGWVGALEAADAGERVALWGGSP